MLELNLARFVKNYWETYGEELCHVLPRLAQAAQLTSNSINCPPPWQYTLVDHIKQLSHKSLDADEMHRLVSTANIMMDTFGIFGQDAEILEAITESLVNLLVQLPGRSTEASLVVRDVFAIGRGLKFIVESNIDETSDLWSLFCRNSSKCMQMPIFWENLVRYIRRRSEPTEESALYGIDADDLRAGILQCLKSPSHALRLPSLQIIRVFSGKASSQLVETALQIELTAPDLQNARVVSHHIRKLAEELRSMQHHDFIRTSIVSYLFGILHVKFEQTCADSLAAIKEVYTGEGCEWVVTEIAFDWIAGPGIIPSDTSNEPVDDADINAAGHVDTTFNCSNLARLLGSAEGDWKFLENLKGQSQLSFDRMHSTESLKLPVNRLLALRVLNKIPHLAEKRSRLLVPILLEWAKQRGYEDMGDSEFEEPSCDQSSASLASYHKWSRKELKALLGIFSQFTNPKVLYKSVEAHSALLSLLANGDVEIQKSALRAILTWNNKSITRYEENLSNLLDDKRFREQITVFLDVGNDDSEIELKDRAQLTPVLLHLLYGKCVARSGSASGRNDQSARRRAVFDALARLGPDGIRGFLKIALGSLHNIAVVTDTGSNEVILCKQFLDNRRMFGFVNMTADILKSFRSNFAPYVTALVDPLLYCLLRTCRQLNRISITPDSKAMDEKHKITLLRSIRQAGTKGLCLMFQSSPELDWTPYIPLIHKEIIHPRLEKLPIETAQSVSGLLHVFSTWASSVYTFSFLVTQGRELLTKVVDCLVEPSAKDEVKLFVLEKVFGALLSQALELRGSGIESSNVVSNQVLGPFASVILSRIGELLSGSPSKELLDASVKVVANLSVFVRGVGDSHRVVEIAVSLMKQPASRVSPATKSDLVKICHGFIPESHVAVQGQFFQEVCRTISSQFGYFKDRKTRQLLCDVLEDLAALDATLGEAAALSRDLNSFSPSRLDEPDFDRRAGAYNVVNEEKCSTFTPKQWQPLLYNMLYFIKEKSEISIRASSSLGLRRFVEAASHSEDGDRAQYLDLLSLALLPALISGLKEGDEIVRVEYVHVLGHLVRHFQLWEQVGDLRDLLASGEEEASFFNNILHIQFHRRQRALHRLAELAKSGKIGATNIYRILIPLLEHYIFDKADDSSAGNLASESITTIGVLSEWLNWHKFKGLLLRYVNVFQSKPETEKTTIRLLGSIIDALSRAGPTGRSANGALCGSSAEAPRNENEMDIDDQRESLQPTLRSTLPGQKNLGDDLTKQVIPALAKYVNNKDDSTVSLRVPVAASVVKLLMLLPESEFLSRLPPVLLDLSYILRSKDQVSRDACRRTLAEVTALIGPSFFGFVVRELRTALQRGYQLHVLSFTVHSILVTMTPRLRSGDLDYCLGDMVSIVIDDIFGKIGQEKDAEDYVSKMKEVKSSKSFDSMELITRISTLEGLSLIVTSVKDLLVQRMTLKTVRKVDELLRRIGLGLLHNEAAQDRGALIFCYNIIEEARGLKATREDGTKSDANKYVKLKNVKNTEPNVSTSSYLYKLERFAFDVLRTVLRRHERLQTAKNLSGFMPFIGDALEDPQEEIHMAAMKLLSTIIKVPVPQIRDNAAKYVSGAVVIIDGASSNGAETAQAALKLITAVLRERQDVDVRERDVAFLLKKLKGDLEEPDRQGAAFNFIKAVIHRKMVVPELYDIVDSVSAIMITNQTRAARDLARGIYFQFLMEYPQAQKRFSKQVAFLVKNLDYKHPEGRQSVMEAMHLLITKLSGDQAQGVIEMLFLPLVMAMVNDDSQRCRELAAELIKQIHDNANQEKLAQILSSMNMWIEQEDSALLRRCAIQCWTILLEAREEERADRAPRFLGHLESIVRDNLTDTEGDAWETIWTCLDSFQRILKICPSDSFAAVTLPLWGLVHTCVAYPHAWVKYTAARLLGSYFAHFARANSENGLAQVPLHGSEGLELPAEAMREILRKSLRVLYGPTVGEDLVAQTVKNVAFLGRCFAFNEVRWQNVESADGADMTEGLSSDDDTDGEVDRSEPSPSHHLAIEHLLNSVARVLRRQPTNRISRSAVAITAAPTTPVHVRRAVLLLLGNLCASTPLGLLEPSLPQLLRPLLALTDAATTIPHATAESHKALRDSAREILDDLQARLGTGAYVRFIGEAQRGARQRRDERRRKRVIDKVAEPERVARDKRRRREAEKRRRKERNEDYRGRRRGW